MLCDIIYIEKIINDFLHVRCDMEQQSGKFIKQQKKMMVILTLMCFLMLVVIIILSWYVFDYSSAKIQKNNETVTALLKNVNLEQNNKKLNDPSVEFSQKEQIDYANLSAEDVVRMVSKHILLAKGDITVATVMNIDGLRTDYPELFTYAKNGDKLIFYPLGIIIYDPVLDRVVDVMRRLPTGTVVPQSVDEAK